MRGVILAVLVATSQAALPKLPQMGAAGKGTSLKAGALQHVADSQKKSGLEPQAKLKRNSVFDHVIEENGPMRFVQQADHGGPDPSGFTVPAAPSSQCNHFLADGTVEIDYCNLDCPPPQVVIDDGSCCGKCGFQMDAFATSTDKTVAGGGGVAWRPSDLHLMTSRQMSWEMSSPHSGEGNCHVSRVRAQSSCPRQCTGHGFCGIAPEQKGYKYIASTVLGKCYCHPGWKGYDCSQEKAEKPTAIIMDSGNPKAEFLAEKSNVITITIISPDKLKSVAVSRFAIGNESSYTNFQITPEEAPPSNVWVVAYSVRGTEQGPVSFTLHLQDFLDRDQIVTNEDEFVHGKVAVTNFMQGAKYWRLRSLQISMGGYIPDYAWQIQKVQLYKTDDTSQPHNMLKTTVLASSEKGSSCGFLGISCDEHQGELGVRFKYNMAVTSKDSLRFNAKLLSFPRGHGPRMLQPGNTGKYIGVGKLSHCTTACEDLPECAAFTYSSTPASFGCLLHTVLDNNTMSSGSGQTTYYKFQNKCMTGMVMGCDGTCYAGKGRDPTEACLSADHESPYNCDLWGCPGGGEAVIPFGKDLWDGFADMAADPYFSHEWKASDNAPDEWISFGFDEPQKVGSILVMHPDPKKAPASAVLEQSNDFVNWMPVVVLDDFAADEFYTVLPSVYDAATARYSTANLLQRYDAFEDYKQSVDFSTKLEDQLLVDMGTGETPQEKQILPTMKFCYYTLDASQVDNIFSMPTYDEPTPALAAKFYVPRGSGYSSLPSRDLIAMPVVQSANSANSANVSSAATSLLEVESTMEKQAITGIQLQEDALDMFGCDNGAGYTWCPYTMSCVQDFAGGDGGPCLAPGGSLEPPSRPPTAFVFHDESKTPGVMSGNVSIVPAFNSHLDESIAGYTLYFTDRDNGDIMYVVDKQPIAFLPKAVDVGGVVVGRLQDVPINENATHLLLVSTNVNGDMPYGITRPIQEQYNIYGDLGSYRTSRCSVWRPGGPNYHDVQGFTFAPERSFLEAGTMAVRFGGKLRCSDPDDPHQTLTGQGTMSVKWVMFHSPDGTNMNAKMIPKTKDNVDVVSGEFKVVDGGCQSKHGGPLSAGIDVSGYVDLYQGGFISMWYQATWETSDPGDYALVCDNVEYEIARGAILEVDESRAPSVFFAGPNKRGSEDAVIELVYDKPTVFSGTCDSDEGLACVRTWVSGGCPAAIPALPGLQCDAADYAQCYAAPAIVEKCSAHRNCDSQDANQCIAKWLSYGCPESLPDMPPLMAMTITGPKAVPGMQCQQFLPCTVQPILNGECGDSVDLPVENVMPGPATATADFTICRSEAGRLCIDGYVSMGCPASPAPMIGTTDCTPFPQCYPLAELAGRCDSGANFRSDEAVDDYKKYTPEVLSTPSSSPSPRPYVPSVDGEPPATSPLPAPEASPAPAEVTTPPDVESEASDSESESDPDSLIPDPSDIMSGLNDGIGSFGDQLSGVGNSLGDMVGNLGGSRVGGAVSDATSGVSEGVSNAVDGIGDVGQGLSKGLGNAASGVTNAAGGVTDGVSNALSSLGGGIANLGGNGGGTKAQRHVQMALQRAKKREEHKNKGANTKKVHKKKSKVGKTVAVTKIPKKPASPHQMNAAVQHIQDTWKQAVESRVRTMSPQERLGHSRMQPPARGVQHEHVLVQTTTEQYAVPPEQPKEVRDRERAGASLIKHLLDFTKPKQRAAAPNGNQLAPPEMHRANMATEMHQQQQKPIEAVKLGKDFKKLREDVKAKFFEEHEGDSWVGNANNNEPEKSTKRGTRSNKGLDVNHDAFQYQIPNVEFRAPAAPRRLTPIRKPEGQAIALNPVKNNAMHPTTTIAGAPAVHKTDAQRKLDLVQKLRKEHQNDPMSGFLRRP